jgi:formate C-acetyltransferase
MINALQHIEPTSRINSLRNKTLSAERYLSTDQAMIITRVYRENEDLPVMSRRAKALSQSLAEIPISIDPEELIVGNRTSGVRAGVVFPEAGISWLRKEIAGLPYRAQDPFNVLAKDASDFMQVIEPFWRGKTLEDDIYASYGRELKEIEKVVKINQKDHAQGHICPDVKLWLDHGPSGILELLNQKINSASDEKRIFYESAAMVMTAARNFILRYADLASVMAKSSTVKEITINLQHISEVCNALSERPPADFREALQSAWFLFVILHMESNASSFSPGRMDQYLYPYYLEDLKNGKNDIKGMLELVDSLFIKFNQIVYLRNENSARYFAGFPIGFNVTLGGIKKDGADAANELSFNFLKAQEHVRLPQPNLTARLSKVTNSSFIDECSRIIGLGTGLPQIANDESIMPSLAKGGVSTDDLWDYVLVGCVELSTQGNFLGWSDAAMFNMVKVLELAINNGVCMLTGDRIGIDIGSLSSYESYQQLEKAFEEQMNYFIEKMIKACEVVEEAHQKHLPSPFLSCFVKNCIDEGTDVTAGGAKYNFSGIQAIQVADIADSLAAIRKLVYDDQVVKKEKFLKALQENFKDNEILRHKCLNMPKYGNDIEWVDELGAKWVRFFNERISRFKNFRGGEYHTGLYTVSAHVPMGANVGASASGRLAGAPLADGGLSPSYGQDKNGPTAVIRSVSRIPSDLASNGSLLNMKFLPEIFLNENDRSKFTAFLRSIILHPIHHIQFNVVNTEDLLRAKEDPLSYRSLTIRVAGYTAFFTELAPDLQDEIISRTTHC